MSKLATLALIAALGCYLVQGPHAAAVSPHAEWVALFASTHAGPSLPLLSPAGSVALGPAAAGKEDARSDATAPRTNATSGTVGAAADKDDADYKAQREECESLPGDARNHCIEYVKLRFERS
jgi:hypothetical protein